MKNKTRLSTEHGKGSGSKGDLKREEKVGKSSFEKHGRELNGKVE